MAIRPELLDELLKECDRLTCFGPLRVRLFGLLKSLPG